MGMIPIGPGGPGEGDINFQSETEMSNLPNLTQVAENFLVSTMEYYAENLKANVQTDFDEAEISMWLEEAREILGAELIPDPLDAKTQALIIEEMRKLHERAYQSVHEIMLEDKAYDKRNAAIKAAQKLQAAGELVREDSVSREESIRRALEIATEMFPAVNPKRNPQSLVDERRRLVE